MSMILDTSITSEKDSPTRVHRHSLCQDLENLATPSGNNISESLSDVEPNQDSVLQEVSLEIIPSDQPNAFNETEVDLIEKEEEKHEEESKEKESNSSTPETINIIEDELLFSKESFSFHSKLSEQSPEINNESFIAFLNIKESSYNGIIKSFHILFQNVRTLFGERMGALSKNYLTFFKIKDKQEKATENLIFNNNSHNDILYMNCSSLVSELISKIEKEKEKRIDYIHTIRQTKNKLEKHIQSIEEIIEQKEGRIIEIHKKLMEIEEEMAELILTPEGKKNKSLSLNPQLYTNSFMKTKYLMGKEKSYLAFIGGFLEKVLKFVSYVCFEVEPSNCLVIKECMMNYGEAVKSLVGKGEDEIGCLKTLEKTNCYQEVYEEICGLLEMCIPSELINHRIQTNSSEYNGDRLKKVIESIINESQSLVYLPVIQLSEKDYVYHSKNHAKVKWSKVTSDFKYKETSLSEIDAYVILTKEGYLILELLENNKQGEEKMATLKLSDIKLSQKSNKVIISDRGKGVVGYLLSSNLILGVLTFNLEKDLKLGNEDEVVDEFCGKIKEILEFKKGIGKGKKI